MTGISDRRNKLPNYCVPIGGQWQRISDKWMREVLLEDSLEDYLALDYLIYSYQMNPLSFSLPHGKKRRDKHGNDGTAFVNDRTSELLTLTAGSQLGKSYTGAIKMLMHIVPTEPDWPCFKEHGIEWHEWAGPQKAIVASLKFEPNVRIVWETYMQICPRKELGDLAPSYGIFPDEKGKGRIINFHSGTQVVRLACGSEITLLSYHQNINSFESMQADIAHCDEQPKEQQYDAIAARQRTRGDYTPIFSTMTPIMIDGRADTGAAGFLIKDVMGKKEAKGRKVGNYSITVDSVPDVFIGKDKKAQMYEECIGEPMREKNDIQLRHGKARYYGEPEAGGAGIIASFNPEVHMIEKFDIEKFKPTWMRFLDHGTKPCAALKIAMMPWGDFVVVDEYYEYNPSTSVHARQLVEDFCGNERIQVSTYDEDGATWPVYEENPTNTEFYVSECDIRSFNSPSTTNMLTIGQFYNQQGYTCRPASGTHREMGGVIDIMNDMFALDPKRMHINTRLGRPVSEATERSGAPAIYMYNHCKNLKAEIEGWIENPKTGKAMDGDDHLISCFVGETLVTTREGMVRIDEIRHGDTVLTSAGYKMVEVAEMTGIADIWELEADDGRMLHGTASHPIYDAKTKSFISLDKITPLAVLLVHSYSKEELCRVNHNQSASRLTASTLGVTQSQNAGATGYITDPILATYGMESKPCTLKSGKAFMEKCRKVALSIIRTAIRLITILRTLSALRSLSISRGIPTREYQKNIRKNGWPGRRLGVNLLKVERNYSGVLRRLELLLSKCGENIHPLRNLAKNAVSFSSIEASLNTLKSAQSCVKAGEPSATLSTMLKECALVAENSTKGGSTTRPIRLAGVVAPRNLGIKRPVYNLQVRDCPEYFANGILVHNCMIWLAAVPRRYMGDYMLSVENDMPVSRRKVDRYSKY